MTADTTGVDRDGHNSYSECNAKYETTFHCTKYAALSGQAEDGKYSIRVIDRAIDVLMAFDQERPALSLATIAARANLSKPTAFRILSSLRQRGFVNQTPDGDYELGYEIVRLAAVRKRQTQVEPGILFSSRAVPQISIPTRPTGVSTTRNPRASPGAQTSFS